MTDKKINEETLNKIYRNAHIALQSISNVRDDRDGLSEETLCLVQKLLDFEETCEKTLKSLL